MNNVLETIYYNSPALFQNVGVSLMGAKLYHQRYGGRAESYLKELWKSEKLNEKDIRSLQESRFVELAQSAIEKVPYYRNWARRTGITTADIKTINDLNLFPLLDKETVRQSPEQFVSDDFRNSVFSMNTSGTSGTPLTVYSDRGSRTHHYAFFSRLRGWFGLAARSKRATLMGRVIMRSTQRTPPFWRMDWPQNNLLMSSYHLSDANIPYYYEKLRRYRPSEIFGYPSSIYQLARYIVNNRLEPLTLSLVMTTAETLLTYQRDMIQRAFHAPIVNQYGCTEMAFFASQCEYGTMHLHPEHGIAEMLTEQHTLTREPGTGELVATGLVNSAMPLIRYRIGDKITIASGACDCDRAFPILSEIEGRLDDILYQNDGTPVGRLDPVFKGSQGIIEAQIIQHPSKAVTIKVVPSSTWTDKTQQQLLYELQKRFGDDIPLAIELMESIPRGPGGKFKAVINEGS